MHIEIRIHTEVYALIPTILYANDNHERSISLAIFNLEIKLFF
jgi:hypothetical protein